MINLARKEILNMLPYVPGKPIDEVKREYGLSKVIKLASNENPLGPSPMVVEAIREAVTGLSIYPDGYCYDLRKKLSEKFNFDMDAFIFGDGTDEVLELLFKAFVSNDDEVVFGDPSFVEYYRNTELMGGKPVRVPLTKDLEFDLDAISNSVTSKTKMVFICNPNNPTGTIVRKESVDKFVESIPSNVLIVFDEAYFEYAAADPSYPNTLDYQVKGMRNVITLRTFSKAYGLAGLRIGYGIADKEIIEILEKVRLPFNVGNLSQIGAIAAIDDVEHLTKSITLNEQGKQYIYAELDKLALPYIITYANFILINVNRDSKHVFESLIREGVIIRPMGGSISHYIRVTTGTMEENIFFIEKLKKVLV